MAEAVWVGARGTCGSALRHTRRVAIAIPDPDPGPLEIYQSREDQEQPAEPLPRDRATVMASARRARLEEGGLPVDEQTLARVADAVLSPDYPFPGLYYTLGECHDHVPEEVDRALDAYLDAHPGSESGYRRGWHDGRRVNMVAIVGDPEPHRAALAEICGDRVVIESALRTSAELSAVEDAVHGDWEQLSRQGFEILGLGIEGDFVDVMVAGGQTAEEAAEFFRQRYGEAIAIDWCGPSVRTTVPHPFGSWSSERTTLTVYFALDYNGEEFESAELVEETGQRIAVALTRTEGVGIQTRIDGFRPMIVNLELQSPVAGRPVVDHATGVERPERSPS